MLPAVVFLLPPHHLCMLKWDASFFTLCPAAAGGLRRCSYDFRCLGVLWPFGYCHTRSRAITFIPIVSLCVSLSQENPNRVRERLAPQR